MLFAIARFEFRYLLRNPLVWITAALTFAGLLASTSTFGFELGSEGGLLRNSSYATLRNCLMISLVYMFVITAFVSNAVLRDDDTGYGPIMRATRMSKADYLFGRFLGSVAVVALCLALVPIGMWIGTLMPWTDPSLNGPNQPVAYFYGYFLLALPNLIVCAAMLFALATLTRSVMGTYLGVIAFGAVIFFVDSALGDRPQLQWTMALFDPSAGRPISDAARYWTIPERNVLLPDFSGILLGNRVLWLTVAAACLAFAYSRFTLADRGLSRRERRRLRADAAVSRDTEHERSEPPVSLPSPRHNGAALRALLWMRTKFEARQVVFSPTYPVLMAFGMFTTLIGLTVQRDPDGRPTYPTTLSLIPELQEGFFLVPVLVAIYFAGELVWRERDRRMHELVDSTSMPSWAYVVPKTLAMGLVLISMMLTTVIASMIVQLALGYTALEPGKYLLWYALPAIWDMMLLAALAVFVHALSPHKAVGWGVMVMYMVWQQLNKSIDHNLLIYSGKPEVPLSDFNDAATFWGGAWTFRLYWGAAAVLMLLGAHLLWRRGVDVRLRHRLARARRSLHSGTAAIAAVAVVVLLSTGFVAYRNTNALNGYRTPSALEKEAVEFERRYGQYFNLAQPNIDQLTVNVALYPAERRAEVSGQYRLRNQTGQPITDVHVRTVDRDYTLLESTLADATLALNDTTFRYRIYHLTSPMLPGESRMLTFRGQRWIKGFRNGDPETRLVVNGSFLGAEQLGPFVGTAGFGRLQDPDLRKKYGLPLLESLPTLEDSAARWQPSFDRGWGSSDITVSTSADQVPIASGNKVSDVISNGRRTARYVSTAPVRARYVVLSARYAERHRSYKGVDFAVYYHPTHGWNVDRMLDAMTASLDYYQANFGPYQFDHFRIVEVPGYVGFAQAFGGTVPFSESVGFHADYKQPETIDQVTGMTAHEFAHQWWAHQVAAAGMEGEGVLSETLAQYAAHVVMQHQRGTDQIRRYLQFELDQYLGFRSANDPPLARARGETHLLYRKGALVMMLLQQRLGEAAINRALQSLITRFTFQGAPFATSRDLIDALRKEAHTPQDQALITDLFERVTLYDLRVNNPTAVRRADGKWDVTVPVEARKLYVDSTGSETVADLNEPIDIGLFTAEPGLDAFSSSKVLLMERRPIHSGRQVLTFVTASKPTFAGVDPYILYIDRRSRDNVAAVQ